MSTVTTPTKIKSGAARVNPSSARTINTDEIVVHACQLIDESPRGC